MSGHKAQPFHTVGQDAKRKSRDAGVAWRIETR